MKTLCLYYSRTNLTKTAMEQLAELTGADIFEYTDGKDRKGVFGYIGACFASFKKALSNVSIKGEPDLSSYDRVIIGMPVWAEKPCVIGRAFIKRYAEELPGDVYYVVTRMGKGDYSKKIKAMDDLLGRPSGGQLCVKTKDNDFLKEIREFAEKL